MRPYLVIAAIMVLSLYTVALGNVPLQTPDEPREAEIARELWVNGPLTVPQLDGEPFVEKPPLVYWTEAALFAIGRAPRPPDGLARLAPALFTLGMILATFLLGRGWFSTRHGALAALILATSPEVLVSGRRLTTDPALACFTTMAVGSALTAIRAVRGRRFALFVALTGLGVALAFLAKGPEGPVIAGAALAGAIVIERGVRGLVTIRALAIFAATLACLAPAVALWVFILRRGGDWSLVQAWLRYHWGGALGTSGDHVKPWWFYLKEGVPGALPWLVFVPFAGPGRADVLAPGGHPRFKLRELVTWTLAILALLSSLSQKRVVYTLPLYPPLALLAATAILEPPKSGVVRSVEVGLFALVSAGLILAATLGPFALAGYAVHASGGWAALSTQRMLHLAIAALLLSLAAVLVILMARREAEEREAAPPYPLATASLGAILALGIVVFVMPLERVNRSVNPAAREVALALAVEPRAKLVGYALEERLRGALPYELGRTFPSLTSREELVRALDDPDTRVVTAAAAWESAGRPGRKVREIAIRGGASPLLLVAP